METKLTLTTEQIKQCTDFALQFIKSNKSFKSFGSKDRRNLNMQFVDTVSGKLGEIAFAQFLLDNYNIQIGLDFNITIGSNSGDNGNDISIVNDSPIIKKVDVKVSKQFAVWFLIESYRMTDYSHIMADCYVFVKLDLPRDIHNNISYFKNSNINAEIIGFISKNWLFGADGIPIFSFNRGDRLYTKKFIQQLIDNINQPLSCGYVNSLIDNMHCSDSFKYTSTRLKANNIGMPLAMLSTNFDLFVKHLLQWRIFDEREKYR